MGGPSGSGSSNKKEESKSSFKAFGGKGKSLGSDLEKASASKSTGRSSTSSRS